MHYDAYAFSTNGRPTIEPRDTRVKLSSIGQRRGFTDLDLQHVNALYGCNSQPSGWYIGISTINNGISGYICIS